MLCLTTVLRERCVSGRDGTRWIERHLGEANDSLTRKKRIDHDHGSLLVTVLQALVMRRSSVRIRQGAPWKTPGQASDLGFLILGDLGIRADRASVGYASQCVGPRLTASGDSVLQACELVLFLLLLVRLGLFGSVRWPFGGRACGHRADRLLANRVGGRAGEGDCCGTPTITRSACCSFSRWGRTRWQAVVASPDATTAWQSPHPP